MIKYLRLAIVGLPAVATPITCGMAGGLPRGSRILTSPAPLILVDKYQDIKACQQTCADDRRVCLSIDYKPEPQYPTFKDWERYCNAEFAVCYDRCRR
jgi:hypothetical protein